MLFGLLFEFSDFGSEVLKIALEARICLLHLYVVYRYMRNSTLSSRTHPDQIIGGLSISWRRTCRESTWRMIDGKGIREF